MLTTIDRQRERLSHRIVRSLALARERAATADLLNFYADLCEFQQSLLPQHSRVLREANAFADALDARAAALLAVEFARWLDGRPQQGLAGMTRALLQRQPVDWEPLLDGYWHLAGESLVGVEEVDQFVAEALLQPFAESLVSFRDRGLSSESESMETAADSRCPACGGRAFLATLRERGHGARRSLMCGFCLSDWPAPRVSCPNCGEHKHDSLFVYRSEEFPEVRIDACQSCQSYLKTIDLTRNGIAVPVVDDLASLAMDLWAAGRGYRKVRPNLLRL
jgi:FdhE protein